MSRTSLPLVFAVQIAGNGKRREHVEESGEALSFTLFEFVWLDAMAHFVAADPAAASAYVLSGSEMPVEFWML